MRKKQGNDSTEYYLFNAFDQMKVYSKDGIEYGYYGYDAGGERTYKISLKKSVNQVSLLGGEILEVDKLTMYPNGYINIDQFGNYTKHYYAEDQRIASKIGGGYSGNICQSLIAPDPIEVMKEELGKVVTPNEVINQISYVSNSLGTLRGDDPTAYERGLYFYHGNHLSSTQIITDITGSIIQQVLYAPFGEVISEYNSYWHNGVVPDYMFNGKELDEESGMYYYSARYYAPPTFISRDPHFESYPTYSPYTYCYNNPVNTIDPNGKDGYLLTWFSSDGETGHAGIAVDNYKKQEVRDANGNIVKDAKGNPTYEMVKDGTMTYYDLWPFDQVGKTSLQSDVNSDYSKGVVINSLNDLKTKDPTGSRSGNVSAEGRPADGIVQIKTTYEQDMKIKAYASNTANSGKKYNASAFNCSTFAENALKTVFPSLDASQFVKVSFPLSVMYNDANVTAPNNLYNAAMSLPGATNIKGPKSVVAKPYLQYYGK